MLTEKQIRKLREDIRSQKWNIEGITAHSLFLEGRIKGYNDVLEDDGMISQEDEDNFIFNQEAYDKELLRLSIPDAEKGKPRSQ